MEGVRLSPVGIVGRPSLRLHLQAYLTTRITGNVTGDKDSYYIYMETSSMPQDLSEYLGILWIGIGLDEEVRTRRLDFIYFISW